MLTLPTSRLRLSAFMLDASLQSLRHLLGPYRGISARWGRLMEEPPSGDVLRLDYMLGQDNRGEAPHVSEPGLSPGSGSGSGRGHCALLHKRSLVCWNPSPAGHEGP